MTTENTQKKKTQHLVRLLGSYEASPSWLQKTSYHEKKNVTILLRYLKNRGVSTQVQASRVYQDLDHYFYDPSRVLEGSEFGNKTEKFIGPPS